MNDELNGLKSTATGVADADVTAAATDLRTLINTLCPNGAEWKTVGECCNVSIGEFVKKDKQSDNAPYPVYNGGTTNTGFYEKYNTTPNKVIISARGASAGFVNKVNTYYWAGNSCYTLDADKNTLSWEYLYYALKCKEHSLLGSQAKSAIPAISKKQVENFRIPVPPLAVQAKIVQILNKFTELAKELAKEKQARRTQYEYYRDWLLDLAHPEGKQGKVWDLLRTLCPNGVEWKTLGDIASISRGGSLQRKDFRPSGVPCIHYGQIYTSYNHLATDHTISFIDEACAARQKFANKNDLIMTVTSENVRDVCKCIVWLGQERVAVSGHTVIIQHSQNPKYLAYYFSSAGFFKQKRSLAYGTKVIDVSLSALSKVRIPVPPLAVQAEIVRILDQFSTLAEDITAGLPAEIAARQAQYEYYRNQLLSFKDVSDRAPGC